MTENIGLYKQVEITTDEKTVWVNTERGCIARFGEFAYEIPGHIRHHCGLTLTPLTKEHWMRFVKEMKDIYKLEIPEQYMPKRFRG
jgi:hypothetical protein